MSRRQYGILAVFALALALGAGAACGFPLKQSALAVDEAAEVEPIEAQPQTSQDATSTENGTGGTIELGGTVSKPTQETSKGGSAGTQNADLLDSEANQVNTHQVPDSSFIYDMSIIDLSSADSYYDNQTVQVLGEVVGDRIFETGDIGHCWITLDAPNTDIDATVVVYMSTEAADAIDTFGKYGTRGTMLQVRGTCHLACSEHQGISDIHADYVAVVQPGARLGNTLGFASFLPGIITLALGGALVALYSHMREKER